ncbi:MAG: helix-turn-helix domain-containing protein [Prevotellaceae bacterium]|jgi:transcriptional regulator with XRE-family HTH domain|nr:helix-turn-helix domain-containing protein [Prevotellaceae bacterium]
MVNLIRIKEIAKLKRITIRELAMAADITEQGLQRLIRTNSTTVQTIDLIAKKLGVPVGVFFGEACAPENDSAAVEVQGGARQMAHGEAAECAEFYSEVVKKKDEQIDRLLKIIESCKS